MSSKKWFLVEWHNSVRTVVRKVDIQHYDSEESREMRVGDVVVTAHGDDDIKQIGIIVDETDDPEHIDPMNSVGCEIRPSPIVIDKEVTENLDEQRNLKNISQYQINEAEARDNYSDENRMRNSNVALYKYNQIPKHMTFKNINNERGKNINTYVKQTSCAMIDKNDKQRLLDNGEDMISMNTMFRQLKELVKISMTPPPSRQINTSCNNLTEITNNSFDTLKDDWNRSLSEESTLSNDNVLITNKYDLATNMSNLEASDTEKIELIPIGSGMTLIDSDKFKKISWKSYSVATRSLLMAAFSRRVLATRSLSGKQSPAFRQKPAKMCLDAKIVSDIILEITKRFNVQESLVRSVITTKCADEAKMLRMRLNKIHNKKLKENLSPEEDNV